MGKDTMDGGYMFGFLKNVAVSLKATGPATVIVVWIAGVTALGLFGSGELAKSAMTFLGIAGGMILFTLATKAGG